MAKMKKTSIAVPDDLWTLFRVANMREGRESQEVIAELIAGHVRKRDREDRRRGRGGYPIPEAYQKATPKKGGKS